jgi:hypothetical protein
LDKKEKTPKPTSRITLKDLSEKKVNKKMKKSD